MILNVNFIIYSVDAIILNKDNALRLISFFNMVIIVYMFLKVFTTLRSRSTRVKEVQGQANAKFVLF